MSTTTAAACASTPSLPIPDTYHSGYSCMQPAAANLRFATCCWNNPVNYLNADKCFEWCHVTEDWYTSISLLPVAPFDVGNASDTGASNGTERLRLSMKACLHADDFPAVADDELICQANSDATASLQPNATAADSCALAHPALAVGGIIPASPPSCGKVYDAATDSNETFARCCDWAPRKFANHHCDDYCYLPHGNAYMGKGNLTDLDAVDSFKRCMLDLGGGEKALDGISCQWNESMRDLKAHNITTTAYLKGAAGRSMGVSWGLAVLVGSLALLGVVAT
ncbi:Uu.00g114850.m01.CDS01 [Anthostomella pinea]|uniref:Uu.00g114850.m01.CDS01 n=1 Tax=Anthostomella pinea TaxID=933095 RepID=A0AAI8VGG0_9PEZI|nr:Uu.00g114850.m01.CDS01 [Anthostomella pinea]